MTVRSQRIGDNLVVTLTPDLLQRLPFDDSTPLQAEVVDGTIVLSPAEVATDLPWIDEEWEEEDDGADGVWKETLGRDSDAGALDWEEITVPPGEELGEEMRSHYAAILAE